MNGVYWMQNNRYVFVDFSFLNFCMHFFQFDLWSRIGGIKKKVENIFFFPISQKSGYRIRKPRN